VRRCYNGFLRNRVFARDICLLPQFNDIAITFFQSIRYSQERADYFRLNFLTFRSGRGIKQAISETNQKEPVMEEVKIGVVSKFFAQPSVAAIDLTDGELRVGDTIHIKGHSTDLQLTVESMQIEHAAVTVAEKGTGIGIKVKDRVRPNDIVYLVKQ
jgi:hypothetical protein